MIRAALLMLAALALPAPTMANPYCGNRDYVEWQLLTRYGEVRQKARAPNSRSKFQVYMNPKTRSYTIVKTMPPDKLCVVETGTKPKGAKPKGS